MGRPWLAPSQPARGRVPAAAGATGSQAGALRRALLEGQFGLPVFGGRGWSTLYRPGRHLMDVRVCRIYEGTDEILKLKIAAGLLGKEYEAFS